ERLRWSVKTTAKSRDGGVDLIATKQDEVGVLTSLYIQCKNYASSIGVEIIRQLNGVIPPNIAGVRGVVVCPGGFTRDAQSFAKERDIALWDRQQLFEMARIPEATDLLPLE
ncbi:MAG: restriction endonuclease, partial [Acidobacteriota bacterium]